MFFSKRRLSFVSLFLLLGSFHATLMAAEFRFLAWDEAMGTRKIGLKSGEQITEVKDLHPLKRSKAVSASLETPPQLVTLDRKDAEGKALSVEIKIPADVQSPLVLVIPDAKHPTGVRPFVIEDNTARFKWGTARVLNATGKAVMMKVDKTVAQLPPAWTPVDIDPGGAKRNMGVQSALKDNPTDILYSAVWEHDPDVRELVIIIPGADGLDFKVIPENRKVIEAEAAAAKQQQ